MGVVSVKELARRGVFEFSQPRQVTREWVCVLSDDTLAGNPTVESQIAQAIPIDLKYQHPTYTNNYVRKITFTEGFEGSPYHVHVVAEYGRVLLNELLHPTSNLRKNTWEFDSAPGQIPALFYYEGSGNSTLRPLTNSAYDYFEGLVTEESMVTARVTKNFASLPTSWIAAQNFINSDDDSYLGCPQYSIKVAKVTVTTEEVEFDGNLVAYWKTTAELQYRQSGWQLQLPDVGFNYFNGSQKRRAMVFDFENAEWVATANPVGLNGTGGQTFGAPAILPRRVNPATNFRALFGDPPTTPIA